MRDLGVAISDSEPEAEGETLSTDELSDVDMIPSSSTARPTISSHQPPPAAPSQDVSIPADPSNDQRWMHPSGPSAARLRSATAASERNTMDVTRVTIPSSDDSKCESIFTQRVNKITNILLSRTGITIGAVYYETRMLKMYVR